MQIHTLFDSLFYLIGCIRLEAPGNATLYCWSEGETKKCTISCNSSDMSFVSPVESEYTCSPESDYKWNHENMDNRRASLPACKGNLCLIVDSALCHTCIFSLNAVFFLKHLVNKFTLYLFQISF